MKHKNIRVDASVLDGISNSTKMTDQEKLSFLQVISYLTKSEQKELVSII